MRDTKFNPTAFCVAPARRHRVAVLLVAAVAVFYLSAALPRARADDKKPADKPSPHVIMALPLGLAAGTTQKIVLRGRLLDQAREVHFENRSGSGKFRIKILSKGRTSFPDKFDAKTAGDTQMEIEVTAPPDAAAGEANIVVTTPAGPTPPHPLLIAVKGTLVPDKKAGGFREAQPLAVGQCVAGTVEHARQVHVYRIDATAGQTIVADVVAARKGSLLDSLLTLYDASGQIVATNDDFGGTHDSHIKATLRSAGVYYLSLVDAFDSGSPEHVFWLRLAP